MWLGLVRVVLPAGLSSLDCVVPCSVRTLSGRVMSTRTMARFNGPLESTSGSVEKTQAVKLGVLAFFDIQMKTAHL